jgi:hypothetical protein
VEGTGIFLIFHNPLFYSSPFVRLLCEWGVRQCEDDPTLYRVEKQVEENPTQEETGNKAGKKPRGLKKKLFGIIH